VIEGRQQKKETSQIRRIALIFKQLALYLTVAVLGFVLGVFALYIYWVRSGPALEIWHTEELTAEFTREKADEIRTFDDYRRLEEKLFAQLDEIIYARTERGPALNLARYSAGSASDPHRWKPNWNRSFELPANAPAGGVLLLHGMSDSPYSLRALGKVLNRHNYWVVGLRLPGHGTIPSGLKTITWEDMAAAVRLCMDHLASRVGKDAIHILGYSTGAPLAIDYSLGALEGVNDPAPASLVLISPAIGIRPAAALASWKVMLSHLPGLEKFAWTSILPEFDPFKYNSFTTNAGDQVHRLTRAVARRVESRAASGSIGNFPPTLVFLSTVDATVSTAAVIDNLLEHLAPDQHKLVLFDINRRNVARTVLVSDPGPLTARLMDNATLPFSLTLVTNANPESTKVVLRRKGPFSKETSIGPLNFAWPTGTFSLSHIALPFPPDDPLYGLHPPEETDTIFLGQMPIQGERGLLRFSADWLVRLRHNPFYELLESRTLAWVENAGGR
jgi:alpha-beta hydrolase superfamily lysophospholipase